MLGADRTSSSGQNHEETIWKKFATVSKMKVTILKISQRATMQTATHTTGQSLDEGWEFARSMFARQN